MPNIGRAVIMVAGDPGAASLLGTTPDALARLVREEKAAYGMNHCEIGERLFISQKTVGVHVGRILAKLGVSGRVEAAAVAIRLGMAGSGR